MKNRPASVPPEARWDPSEKAWIVGRRGADGAGELRYWRTDGSFWCVERWEDKDRCKFVRYHENGELAQDAQTVRGAYEGLARWSRSTDPSTEAFDLPEGIHSSTKLFEDGFSVTQRYFDRDGNEVAKDGSRVPARPSGVPEHSVYEPKDETWGSGRNAIGGEYVGVWRLWDAQGRPMLHVDRDSGDKLRSWRYHPNGLLASEVAYEDGVQARSTRFDEEGRRTKETTHEGGVERTVEWRTSGEVSHEHVAGAGGRERCTMFEPSGAKAREGVDGVWAFHEGGRVILEVDLAPLLPRRCDAITIELARAVDAWSRARAPVALAGLDALDWENAECCWPKYSASLPAYVRGLLAESHEARTVASGELAAQIVHQATVYPATAKVTPFLLALLRDEHTPDRVDLLRLLVAVARPDDLLEARERVCAFVMPDVEKRAEDAWLAVVSAVAKERSLWLEFLRHAEPEARKLAGMLLVLAPSSVDETAEALLHALESEADAGVRCDLVLGLGVLPRTNVSVRFASSLGNEAPLLERVCGALTSLRIGAGDETSAALLVATLAAPEALQEAYGELAWCTDDLVTDVSATFGVIDPTRARPLVELLGRRIAEVTPPAAVVLSSALLRVAFDATGYDEDAKLGPVQREVLRLVGAPSPAWELDVNMRDVLSSFGLPESREELISL